MEIDKKAFSEEYDRVCKELREMQRSQAPSFLEAQLLGRKTAMEWMMRMAR